MIASPGPVAIVGIGLRFPGGAREVASYWKLLCEGRNVVGEIPVDRIDTRYYYDQKPATPGRIMTHFGGYLDGIDRFDPAFFGISPREAERVDPQQRLLCEVAWEAIEDAGQNADALRGSRTAVFVGQWLSDFEGRLFVDPEAVDFYMTLGSGRYAASGRLSYVLDLRGPSVTLDTACSSSLAAIHLAAKSIQTGESDYALAGGVNVILQPHITIAYSQSRMMAPDGRCKFGDASADGYVRSEGAGLVFLKPLAKALADGDRVYAVIRGSAISNDGSSSGSMGTVSRSGQEQLLRLAYRDAGVSPGDVRYVEAHGTGTQGGDPVELETVGTVLADGRKPGERAYVGSVKTNIGHTEGAAGVAGLIKVALSLHHGRIPASLHCVNPNPKVPWAEMPVSIPQSLSDWPEGQGKRLAGVSGFGISGSNAHVVLEEAPPVESKAAAQARDTRFLPLSAKTPEALSALAARYADLLDGVVELDDVCFSAATRRTGLDHRAVFVGRDREAMANALRGFVAGAPAAARGQTSYGSRPRLVFVVPGQGAQWLGMGRALLREEPVFHASLERSSSALSKYVDFDLLQQLHAEPDSPGYRLKDIDAIQPALFAFAVGYAELLKSLGVEPDAVIGHSVGEVAAAHIAGVLDLDRAAQIVCRRSALMRRTSGHGAMALVELTMDQARARLERFRGKVAVAGNNSPNASVISGDPDAVREVLAELERDKIFCRQIKVDVASHSPQMEPLAVELAAELSGMAPEADRVPLYSTVLGRRVQGHELGAEYWGKNLRQPVLFGTTVQTLLGEGEAVFVELGPHPVLVPSIQQTAQASRREVTAVACGRREEPEQALLLTALGSAWCAGFPVDFRHVFPNGGRAVALPLYPFQYERHWVPAAEPVPAGAKGNARQKPPDDEAFEFLHRFEWVELGLPEVSEPAAASFVVLSDDESRARPFVEALGRTPTRAVHATLSGAKALLSELRAGPGVSGVVLMLSEQADAAYQPVAAVRALIASNVRARLWVVTTGAQALPQATAARIAVEQGAAWGTGRVIAEEQPELWGGLVDLDPAASPADSASLLARHLVTPEGDQQVAFRAGRRFGLRIARAARPSAPDFVWRPDGALIITGGLGDIGLHVARAAVEFGVRRLILLGRTPLPPRTEWLTADPASQAGKRIAAVRELEALGVSVHTAAVDVGDESSLRGFLERYAAEAWPPIRGVVHAAAALDNRLVADMEPAVFESALRPKLRGAQLLDRLLPDLDLFVLFSSVVAYLGQAGEANYAAANAGLDALAHDRRARGQNAVSIGWGVWQDTGLAKAHVMNELGRQGIRGFAPEQGLRLMTWLWQNREPTICALPIDWSKFRRARAQRGYALYESLLASSGGSGEEASLGETLARVSGPERRKLLETAVKDSVAKVLKIAPSKLDTKRAFGSMGLSSLLAVELRNALEAALGRSLSATLAWNYPTVTALVDYLSQDAVAPAALNAAEVRPAEKGELVTQGHLAQVAELSDEEALAALLGDSPGGGS